MYSFYTAEEAIEKLFFLNEMYPRLDKLHPVGLYIELKDYTFYKQQYGLDTAMMLHEVLSKYDLETIEKCSFRIPIIVQSFELDALIKYSHISDLPLVMLTYFAGINDDLMFIYSMIVHGVGPDLKTIIEYGGEVDSSFDTPSVFVELAHNLGLGVHPWVIQNDILTYTDNILSEHELYIAKKVDGIFTEFPQTTYAAFTFFEYINAFPSNYSGEC